MKHSLRLPAFVFGALVFMLCEISPVMADLIFSPPSPVVAKQPDIPLDEQMLDDKAVASWVKGAAADTMTFDYTDYEKRLQSSEKHFTKVGWETFDAALKRSRVLDAITAVNQSVSAAAEGEPEIVQEGAVGGKYRWIVRMPLIVTYKQANPAGNTRSPDTLQLNLVLERVSTVEKPDGIAIAQWIAIAE